MKSIRTLSNPRRVQADDKSNSSSTRSLQFGKRRTKEFKKDDAVLPNDSQVSDVTAETVSQKSSQEQSQESSQEEKLVSPVRTNSNPHSLKRSQSAFFDNTSQSSCDIPKRKKTKKVKQTFETLHASLNEAFEEFFVELKTSGYEQQYTADLFYAIADLCDDASTRAFGRSTSDIMKTQRRQTTMRNDVLDIMKAEGYALARLLGHEDSESNLKEMLRANLALYLPVTTLLLTFPEHTETNIDLIRTAHRKISLALRKNPGITLSTLPPESKTLINEFDAYFIEFIATKRLYPYVSHGYKNLMIDYFDRHFEQVKVKFSQNMDFVVYIMYTIGIQIKDNFYIPGDGATVALAKMFLGRAATAGSQDAVRMLASLEEKPQPPQSSATEATSSGSHSLSRTGSNAFGMLGRR